MKIKLPQYTSKDYLVLGFILLPLSLILNSVILEHRYFSNWQIFLFATIVTAALFSIDFIICGAVAVLLKRRYPSDDQVVRRLTWMISAFILFTGLFLYILFKGYEYFPFLGYNFNETGFIWAYIGMAIINIFLTFLHEGIARYENWKSNLVETEELRKVYRQGRLLGLKSQINPHFLFNSLNCLSSLIHEDEKKGEKFLDEMSKVYRYMLQNDEETLVTLRTELKFLDSYVYLLQERHCGALKIDMEIRESEKDKWIPPLTLQTIAEDIFGQNSICRDTPLEIGLFTDEDGHIVIKHNVVPKMASETHDQSATAGPGLDNILHKYRLLNQPGVLIEEAIGYRTVRLPLITSKEEVLL